MTTHRNTRTTRTVTNLDGIETRTLSLSGRHDCALTPDHMTLTSEVYENGTTGHSLVMRQGGDCMVKCLTLGDLMELYQELRMVIEAADRHVLA